MVKIDKHRIKPKDQIDIWSSEIKLLHEDTRLLEQNIVSAGGFLISALTLSAGLFMTLRTESSNIVKIFPTLYPFFCVSISLIGSAFLMVTSYLGYGIIRADIYIRYLNNLSQKKLGILISGWENWRHQEQGRLPTSIERTFYSMGHGLFVLFTCIMSLGVAITGLFLFYSADKSLLEGYIRNAAWAGFAFAFLMFASAAIFFCLTCWITFGGVYRVSKNQPRA